MTLHELNPLLDSPDAHAAQSLAARKGRAKTQRLRASLSNLILPVGIDLDHPLVHTPSFKDAASAMTGLLRRNKIGLIDGPPGTGKTTFAQWAAAQADRPSAIATMPENPAPHDILRVSIAAVTGASPHGENKTELEAELVEALADWGGLLVLDEVQNVRLRGLTEARYIHDVTRPRFPLLLVGYGALDVVAQNNPLDSRIRTRRMFRPLVGEDLFKTIRSIDPAWEKVSDDLIRLADDKHGRGNLRAWLDIIEQLQDWEVATPKRVDIEDAVESIRGVA